MINIAFSVNKVPKRLTDERWMHNEKGYIMATAAMIHELYEALPYLKKIGAKHIWFDFDKEADVLYVSLERPQQATDTDILDDGTLLRLRGKAVVGITITNMSKRFK
ncbi:MAG: DUF2283 domain-containing protein [Desulfobacterales bacterium]|jgi:uncharacterized protein YuzE|nr:DUF2283 domain-containing protein [Desulfobacterales bacterium]